MKSSLVISLLLALNFLPQLATAQPDWPDRLTFNSTIRLGQEWQPLSLTNDLNDTLTIQGYRSGSAVFWVEGLESECRLGPRRTIHLRGFADPDSGGDLESTVTILTDYPDYPEHVVHCNANQLLWASRDEVPFINGSDQDIHFVIVVEQISAPEGAPDQWVWVEPDSGTVLARQEIVIIAYYRENEMVGGSYEAVLHTTTDNPRIPESDYPLYHQVEGIARMDTDPDTVKVSRADEPPAPGEPYLLDLTLRNIGSDDLEIFDLYSDDEDYVFPGEGVYDSLPIVMGVGEEKVLPFNFLPDDSVYSEYEIHLLSNDPYWGQRTGGYWVAFIADLVVRESVTSPNSPPSEFSLLAAYPNPFNSKTVMPVVLPEAGPITLTIQDVLGRQIGVQELSYTSAGQKMLAINGADWASGIYFATVATRYGRGSVKLVVLR